MNNSRRWYVLLALAALAVTSGALAQGRDGDRRDGDRHYAAEHQHVDNRFAHNHAYYDRGYVVRQRPSIGYAIDRGRDHYWYDRGQWYRRNRSSWIVVGAPIGAYVSILPPFYSTVWFSGMPYYYANDTYYRWIGNRSQYEIVDPPEGIESAGTTQAPASDSIFIYPKNGQSSEQQARDRYECHRYAVEQTGFDPTQASGGVSPEAAASKRADYFRADSACLDGRGYSVR
jgi:hypothetical protein